MALHGETSSNIDQKRVPGLGSIFIVLLLQALLVYLWLLLAFDLVVKFSVKSTHNHEENWGTCHSIINETSNKFRLTPLKEENLLKCLDSQHAFLSSIVAFVYIIRKRAAKFDEIILA